tara:strand:- start:401 stop:601 length:201 start_codon:yes stop_codon:yes gene_type:complete
MQVTIIPINIPKNNLYLTNTLLHVKQILGFISIKEIIKISAKLIKHNTNIILLYTKSNFVIKKSQN